MKLILILLILCVLVGCGFLYVGGIAVCGLITFIFIIIRFLLSE